MTVSGSHPTQLLCLRDPRGKIIADSHRWLAPAAAEDELLLDRAVGPVLDVGCGPGRHLLALAQRGVDCLGIDVTPSAVQLARSRGATVIVGSIFGPVPAAGRWATALLLDGNIGIGGDPVALLARVASVLRPGGRVLVELGAPGISGAAERARVEYDALAGPWFGWRGVAANSIKGIASRAGMKVATSWSAGDRCFAQIATPGGATAVLRDRRRRPERDQLGLDLNDWPPTAPACR